MLRPSARFQKNGSLSSEMIYISTHVHVQTNTTDNKTYIRDGAFWL